MEDIQIILSIAATAIGLLITTVTFLAKFITNSKAKKIAENIIKIGNAILPFVQEAEKFVSYSGSEKKEYVLTKANQFAIDNGIKFDVELVSAKIEEIVAATKLINARGTASKTGA